MTDNEFSVGPHKYRAGQLSAFQQLHVARKMAQSIIFTGGMVAASANYNAEQFAKTIAATSAQMTDADLEQCILTCFSAVSRHQLPQDIWSPVAVNGAVMFDDLNADRMLQIVFHVMRINSMLDFFAVSPADSGQKKGAGHKSSGSRSRAATTSSTGQSPADGANTKA